MTLQQIDQALADWNNRLAAIAENVLDLQADPTYKLLCGSAAPPLEGLTATRVAPALAGMLLFHEQFATLQSALDHAARLRAELPRIFGGEARLAELHSILTARAIQPPAPRNSITPSERVSLDELLRSMIYTFDTARSAILAVSRAWTDLAAEIDSAETRLQQFDRSAPTQAVTLGAAAHLVQGIRSKLQSDPLGASAEFVQHVHPLIQRATALIERTRRNQQTLTEARARCAELRTLRQNALAALSETQARMTDCTALPQPVPEQKLLALEQWLERLAAHPAGAAEEALERGLHNWTASADDLLAQARAILAAVRAPVEQRNELRGRLQALKAKARVYSVAETPAIAALAQRAEALLYTRPTDLRRAAAAIAAYEQSLQTSKKEALVQ